MPVDAGPPPALPEADPQWAPSPWANLPVRGSATPIAAEPVHAEPFAQQVAEPVYAERVAEPAYAAPVDEEPWAPAAVEPTVAEPQPVSYAPIAWGADAVMAQSAPRPFQDLVQGASEAPKPRRSLFGRLRKSAPAPAPEPAPAPAPTIPAAPAMPVLPPVAEPVATYPAPTAAPARTSAFGDRSPEPPVRTGRHRALTPADLGPAPVVAPAPPQVQVPQVQQPQFLPPQVQVPQVQQPQVQQPQAPASAPAPVPINATWMPAMSAMAESWPAPAPAHHTPDSGPDAGPVPAQHGPAGTTSFTPQTHVRGSLDEEVTSMLAQRADIAQQALAELSQLSSYRPQPATDRGATLVRRTPGTIPAAPEIERKAEGSGPARDANQVRSVLSNFQSGSHRGRAAGGSPEPTAQPAPSAGNGLAPAGTIPETDPNSGTTSW